MSLSIAFVPFAKAIGNKLCPNSSREYIFNFTQNIEIWGSLTTNLTTIAIRS